MSRAKTERLLNLVICLLASRRYLGRDEIRRAVPGYPDSDEAFERSFERDKDELREMGVPIETGSNSVLFDDEIGYRIRRDAYALPEITFTAEELSILALAARAWSSGALAGAASRALLKLQAGEGASLDLEAATSLPGLDPRIEGNEAAFGPLWQALSDRRPVRFAYRRRGGETAEQREVEPLGMVARQGRWYLIAHDRGRNGRRVFRISRITGPVTELGRPGEVQIPVGLDLAAEVASFAGQHPQGSALVAVRPDSGGFLRRRAVTKLSEHRAAPDGWDILEVPYTDLDMLAGDVAGLGAAARALEPAELRDAVVRRLRAVAGDPVEAQSAATVPVSAQTVGTLS